MNCDECKEQVFELIEREARDPEGVREVLDRCPDCRALFDEMKAALATARGLPVEAPPSEADAAILRAARARKAEVVPPRRRWFQTPQWAVAAVALLAVGVGVWAIPRGEQMTPTTTEADTERQLETKEERTSELPVDDRARGTAASAEAARPVAAPAEQAQSKLAESDSAANARSPEPAARRAMSPRREPTAAKRKSSADAPQAAPEAEAFSLGAEAASAGASRADAVVEEEVEVQRAREPDSTSKGLSADCRKRIAEQNERRLEDSLDADAPTGSAALELGLCYQAAGDLEAARKWLEVAASDSKTRKRARRALRDLADE